MEFMPRFGHHVIPASQINISEVELSDRMIQDNVKVRRLQSIWYPIIVEVIEEEKEYILVDGLRRFRYWVDTLKWNIVECLVMPHSNPRERQLRRYGMNTLSKSFNPYDIHCAIYGMKKSGISDDQIVEMSGVSRETVQKYLNNIHLPLSAVLEGKNKNAGYDGWIMIVSINSQGMSQKSIDLIKDIYIQGQCYGYQLAAIISAAATDRFQKLSVAEQQNVLSAMCLETKNMKSSLKPTPAELFGFKLPEPRKVGMYSEVELSKINRLLQPDVVSRMPRSYRLAIQNYTSSIQSKFDEAGEDDLFQMEQAFQ